MQSRGYTEDPHTAGSHSSEHAKQLRAQHYKEMMSLFPSGVSVVTARDKENCPQGATCSSLSSITVTPPTLLICLQEGGSTLEAVRSSKRFAINLLHGRGQMTARIFSNPAADRFAKVAWCRDIGDLPHLHHDALALATCDVTHEYLVGDHTIIIGSVSSIKIGSGLPLLYGLRRFSVWPEEKPLHKGG